tara:strand:+ start:270 stop:1313 length:1044 start_codon:yes stop_codon:yes gene_type:complete
MPHEAGHTEESGGLLDFLGNLSLSDLASTGVNLTAYNDLLTRLGDVGSGLASGASTIGTEAAKATKFEPFTVTTGFGTTTATDEGGYTTTLTPEQTARQTALSGITGGLLTDFTGLAPDVSTFQSGALSGAESALTAATGDQATREADVYERIRAAQRPEEERQRLALQEQLQSQGRTGLRTAMFGGSPEQFALEKARAEAQNTAALAALQQAGAERQQNLGAAQGLFGLTGQAAGLPSLLEAAQLQNIGAGLGLEATPEQLLLSTLSPAINIASLADMGRRSGAGLQAEAGISGLEALAQTELGRASALRDLYGGLLGAGSSGGEEGLFEKLLQNKTLKDLFGFLG